MDSRAIGYAALIAANLLPLAGALFFGWQVREILLVYWAESAVIAFYNALRMLLCHSGLGRLPLVAFFLVHFGVFMLVHGVFILVLTSDGVASGSDLDFEIAVHPSMLLAVAAMMITHGASFVSWWASGAARGTDARVQMMAPYARIVVMQVTILGGAFLVQILGSSIGLLVALVLLKLAMDLRGHRRQGAAMPLTSDPAATIEA